MLYTAKELMKEAESRGAAVGAFNVTGLANMVAILEAAEELDCPVILEYAPIHEEEGIISLERIGPAMVALAKASGAKVGVHYDHGVDLDKIKKALDMGFTSIMYDGSILPYEENIANTRKAVELAKKYGASVEAELGKMAGVTMTNDHIVEDRAVDRSNFTNPDQAKDFVERTGVDMLACSFGTVHGIYTSAPRLDTDLVIELREKAGVPIVMHGGSGVSPEDYKKVITNGVRKINYYAYMAKAGGEAVRNEMPKDGIVFIHDLFVIAKRAMKENVKEAMIRFMNKE
ncbi:MAG: class II fructose-bisphosphate aldolase [Erysipelotrichales bacterium]|nr:class II fructose-bisphosphate aldolase [Erysipelotrichales bacterium]MBQ5542869.1 class II fructose-bisphosphate aldolase [Erysipelotrichales bacterium]